MTNIEILEKAIRIAIANGWSWARRSDPVPNPKQVLQKFRITNVEALEDGAWKTRCGWETLVYSPLFAKALWGEPESLDNWARTGTYLRGKKGPENEIKMAPWAWHLQQMVVAEDPVKYLEENI